MKQPITKPEQSVTQQLDNLLELQRIDSRLDAIISQRGALPEEVKDLDDEVAGLQVRIEKLENEAAALDKEVKDRREGMKESETLIKRYDDQLSGVKNNREYIALTKEVELQKLEIQLHEKKIKEAKAKEEQVQQAVEKTKEKLDEKQNYLDQKRKELESVTAEYEEEENKLHTQREKMAETIENRLLKYYDRLRKHLHNGLAVVMVKDGVPEGSNVMIPPQQVAEVRKRSKIIIDEHSGRILAGVIESEIPEVDPKAKRTKRTKR